MAWKSLNAVEGRHAPFAKPGLNPFKMKSRMALACLFVIAAAAVLPSANATAASDAIAHIDVAHGSLIVQRSGVLKPFEASTGSDIFIGDTVTAGDASSARLSFPDGAYINILQSSVIRVNQYIHDSDKYAPERKRVKIMVRVLKGSARVAARPAKLVDYQIFIETETAMVSGGASDIVVTASPEETRVVTFKGSVAVRNVLNTIVGTAALYPNQKAVVKASRPPQEPAYMTPEERRAILKETRVRP